MIKKLLAKKINSISIAALMVASSSLLSRLLGVVRDHILAGQFGAGNELDVYYAAFRVPDLVFNLVVLGALSAGFIPVFTQLISEEQRQKEAWELVNNVLNILAVFMLVVVGILFVWAGPLIKLITPGFDSAKLAETVWLTRIMFLSPLLLGISSVVGGVLQSYKRFLIYSLSPIFYNLGIIAGALWLVPVHGLSGLAWGVSLGSAAHLLVQIPTIWQLGWRWQAVMDWKNKQLRVIVRMMTARTLSLVINQINLLVETIFASTLAAGSLAVFNLANNLQSFPVGIFGLSFAIAAFPAIAASAFDREKLVYYFSKTIRQVWYFIVPSMALLILLPGQLVRLVLAGGRFDASDTWLTTQTVSLFAISLFAQATIPLLVRFYYARHDSRTPLRLGLIASVINIALNAWLVKSLGVAGLALAFSLSSVVQFALLLIWLRVEIGTIDGVNLLKSLVKMMMSVLVAAATVQVTKVWWSALGGGSVGAWIWQLMVPAMILMLVYIAMTYLLACPELLGLLGYLKGRWSPTKTEDRGEVSGL